MDRIIRNCRIKKILGIIFDVGILIVCLMALILGICLMKNIYVKGWIMIMFFIMGILVTFHGIITAIHSGLTNKKICSYIFDTIYCYLINPENANVVHKGVYQYFITADETTNNSLLLWSVNTVKNRMENALEHTITMYYNGKRI